MRMFPRKTDTTSGEFWESFPMEDSFRSDRNRLCRPLSSSAKTSVLYSVTNADGDGREVPRRIVLNNSLRGSPVSRTGESRQGLLEVDQKCSPSQLIKRHQLFPVEVPWLPKSLALRLPPVPIPYSLLFESSGTGGRNKSIPPDTANNLHWIERIILHLLSLSNMLLHKSLFFHFIRWMHVILYANYSEKQLTGISTILCFSYKKTLEILMSSIPGFY